MTRIDALSGTSREFDEAFSHFLIESGCVPAAAVHNAWQARWHGPQWIGTLALSTRAVTVREASAVLQLEASTNEPFAACAYRLGILSLQQIAELTLIGYWQRRSFSDCLVAEQGFAVKRVDELQRIMARAVRNAPDFSVPSSESVSAAC
jgi:hypothetical protein